MCREGRKSLPKKDVEQVMKYFFIKRCGKRKNVWAILSKGFGNSISVFMI